MGTNKTSFEITNPEDGEVFTINLTSLVGQVRELFLSKLRNDKEKKTWGKMNQQEQQREIDVADDLSRSIVLAVANIVSAGKNPVIHALLDNYKVKAGEFTVTAKGIANDAAVLALNHVDKKALKIIVVDESQYDQNSDKTEAQADQPDLLDGGEDDGGDGPSLADAMHDAIDQDTESTDTDEVSTDETPVDDDTANDLQPYEQGAGAAEHGLKSNLNPFKPETEDFAHWKRGYQDWKDANPEEPEEPETEVKEIGPAEVEDDQAADETETDDEDSGLAELFDEIVPDETPDAPTIDHDEKETFFDPAVFRKEGVDARVDGKGEDEVPYDGGTDEHIAWIGGWRQADGEIDGIKSEGSSARRDGHSSKKNPWKAGILQHKLWLEGYNEEKESEK